MARPTHFIPEPAVAVIPVTLARAQQSAYAAAGGTFEAPADHVDFAVNSDDDQMIARRQSRHQAMPERPTSCSCFASNEVVVDCGEGFCKRLRKIRGPAVFLQNDK